MVLTKKFKAFDDAILDLHPDLKKALKPNDQYPELEHILKNVSLSYGEEYFAVLLIYDFSSFIVMFF